VIDIDRVDEYFGQERRVTVAQRTAALLERVRHFAERNTL
jgi:hypothetical protein